MFYKKYDWPFKVAVQFKVLACFQFRSEFELCRNIILTWHLKFQQSDIVNIYITGHPKNIIRIVL